MSNLRLSKIKKIDFPLIVFSDNTSGFIEWAIKWRTKGPYNHVMWANRPGHFASQGNTYSEVPFSRYAKAGGRLKFVEVLFDSFGQQQIVLDSINKKLSRPWLKRRYDWLGIFGQAIGLKWINTPWLDYCSEDVPQHLKVLAETLPDGPLKSAIDGIQKYTSPADFNTYIHLHPEAFRVFGRWDHDAKND